MCKTTTQNGHEIGKARQERAQTTGAHWLKYTQCRDKDTKMGRRGGDTQEQVGKIRRSPGRQREKVTRQEMQTSPNKKIQNKTGNRKHEFKTNNHGTLGERWVQTGLPVIRGQTQTRATDYFS